MRHHDELTLDRLTDSERQEIFHIFAPQENMQIFGRGIRRRLPPMMQGDIRRIQLTYSLMFSLPGAPLLRYGDEIGMAMTFHCKGEPVSGHRCSGRTKRMAGFRVLIQIN